MRRSRFFIAPVLGIVFLFFFFKVLFMVLFGAAALGLGFLAFRGLRGQHRFPLHVASMRQRQPEPIDPRYRQQAFDWMPDNRIVEVV